MARKGQRKPCSKRRKKPPTIGTFENEPGVRQAAMNDLIKRTKDKHDANIAGYAAADVNFTYNLTNQIWATNG